jgi:hypothetical protein
MARTPHDRRHWPEWRRRGPKTTLVVALLTIAAPPAFGQSEAARKTCIQQHVKRYASLCESADVLARGIAHACARKPLPVAARGDQAAELDHLVKQAAHEDTYAAALVTLLNARADNPPACAAR